MANKKKTKENVADQISLEETIEKKAPAAEKKEKKAPAAEKKEKKAPAAEKKEKKAPAAEKKEKKAPADEKKEKKAPAAEKKEKKAPADEKKEKKAPAAEKKAPAAEKKAPAAEKKAPAAEKKAPVAEKKATVTEKKEKETPVTEKKPKKSQGFLDTSASKQKLVDDAFADIANQLKTEPDMPKTPKKTPEKPKEKTQEKTQPKGEEKSQPKPENKERKKLEEKPKTKPVHKAEENKTQDAKKSPSKALPSKARLKDLKGEKIEDFIESVSEPVEESEIPEKNSKTLSKMPELLAHFIPVQGDTVTEIVRKGLIVISAILLLVCMVVLIKTTRGNENNEDAKVGIIENYVTEYAVNKKSGSMPQGILEKYYSIYNINNDTVGWLVVPGTQIDLPVVKYSDNQYYATRNFYGKQLTALNAYADCNCNMQDLGGVSTVFVAKGNSISAIDGLSNYLSGQNTDLEISFDTLYAQYTWKIVYCATDTADTLYNTNWQGTGIAGIAEYAVKNTQYDASALHTLTSEDKLLVLVLPTPNEADNTQATLVVAKLQNQQKNDQ